MGRMDDLIHQWREFCAGRSEQDAWYFSGLLQGVTEAAVLTQVFASFPHADALEARALDVLQAGRWGNHLYLQPSYEGHAQARVDAARAWLDELARVAGLNGEPALQATLLSVPVVSTSSDRLEAARATSAPSAYLHDVICAVVRDARTLDTVQVAALDEALYHLASDLYLGWYITQPLAPDAIDFAPYLTLWRLGGGSALVEDAFLVQE